MRVKVNNHLIVFVRFNGNGFKRCMRSDDHSQINDSKTMHGLSRKPFSASALAMRKKRLLGNVNLSFKSSPSTEDFRGSVAAYARFAQVVDTARIAYKCHKPNDEVTAVRSSTAVDKLLKGYCERTEVAYFLITDRWKQKDMFCIRGRPSIPKTHSLQIRDRILVTPRSSQIGGFGRYGDWSLRGIRWLRGLMFAERLLWHYFG